MSNLSPWRQQIIACALRWDRTPFHDLAHVRGVGCDCGGFIIGVAKELDLLPSDYHPPPYSPTHHLHLYEDVMTPILLSCGCTPIPWEARQPGDVVTFKFGLVVSHAGILLPDNEVIHAVIGKGVIRHGLVGTWLALHDRVYCMPGVDR